MSTATRTDTQPPALHEANNHNLLEHRAAYVGTWPRPSRPPGDEFIGFDLSYSRTDKRATRKDNGVRTKNRVGVSFNEL